MSCDFILNYCYSILISRQFRSSVYTMRVTIFSSEMSGKESLGWIFAQGEGVGEGGCYWKITERGSITCMLKPIFHIAIFQTRTWLFCRACIHTYTYQHIPTQGFGSWPTLMAYLRKCPPPLPGYIWHYNLWKAHVILSFKSENR